MAAGGRLCLAALAWAAEGQCKCPGAGGLAPGLVLPEGRAQPPDRGAACAEGGSSPLTAASCV